MKRALFGIAAFALLFVTAESAQAGPPGVWGGHQHHHGGYYNYPANGFSLSYGTPIGNNGFLSVNYARPVWGYSYPAYNFNYVYPAPRLYVAPTWGYGNYHYGNWQRGWGW